MGRQAESDRSIIHTALASFLRQSFSTVLKTFGPAVIAVDLFGLEYQAQLRLLVMKASRLLI